MISLNVLFSRLLPPSACVLLTTDYWHNSWSQLAWPGGAGQVCHGNRFCVMNLPDNIFSTCVKLYFLLGKTKLS